MPVISHPNLPSLERLKSSGLVLADELSVHKSNRKNLHIGLLNLMPDAAFQATERQFVSMLANNEEYLIHLYQRLSQLRTEAISSRLISMITIMRLENSKIGNTTD